MFEAGELAILLDGVREHNQEAACELVERLYPLVRKIVNTHRPYQMAAEDLCQEVFMSIFTDVNQYRGAVPFEHWVSRVAVHTCIDLLRRQRVRPEIRWADLTEEEANSLQSMLHDQSEPSAENVTAMRELVGKLLDCLDPQDRLIIQWMEIEGHTVGEIAAQTGWNKTLVKVRAFRARRKLRKTFERILKWESYEEKR